MSDVKFTETIKKKQDLEKLLDNDVEYDFELVYSVKKNIFKIIRETEEVIASIPDDWEQEKAQEKMNNLKIEIEWYPIKKEYFPKTIKPEELPISIIDLIE